MEKIIFKGINDQDLSKLTKVFEELKEGKHSGQINEAKIKDIIGESYSSKFWPPVEQRLIQSKNDSSQPWNFESWIDAIQNADLTLFEIKNLDGLKYELTLRQNSWPSGGIEAMEELIKIFDAEIVENTMI